MVREPTSIDKIAYIRHSLVVRLALVSIPKVFNTTIHMYRQVSVFVLFFSAISTAVALTCLL